MTREERVIITGHTGVLMLPIDVFRAALEARLDRPVYTHEMGNKAMWTDEIEPAFRDDFIALCETQQDGGVT